MEDPTVLIYDIGRGKFDHHSLPLDTRENDVPYAAFGKVWAQFAPCLYGPEVASKIDTTLVQEIDAVDNGVEGAQSNISRAIHSFNPFWDEDCSSDDQFWLAVGLASTILERAIESVKSTLKAEVIVKEALELRQHQTILVLDEFAPWSNYVIENCPEVLFVVFPSQRGGWNLQTVTVAIDSRIPRKDVPQSWKGYSAGTSEGEAPAEGMTFCHASGFLSSFKEKEQAIAAALSII